MSRTGAAAVSALRPAAERGSSLAQAGPSQSSLAPVAALKSELGATETERGTFVSLAGDITFDYDKATIAADARPTLDKLAELIKAQKASSVMIEGHTDAKGDDSYNQRLSEERAIAVRDYLISVRTVDGTGLETKGFGELKPVAASQNPDGTDNPDGRAKNRRVEVILGK